eukprot:g6019.t1
MDVTKNQSTLSTFTNDEKDIEREALIETISALELKISKMSGSARKNARKRANKKLTNLKSRLQALHESSVLSAAQTENEKESENRRDILEDTGLVWNREKGCYECKEENFSAREEVKMQMEVEEDEREKVFQISESYNILSSELMELEAWKPSFAK